MSYDEQAIDAMRQTVAASVLMAAGVTGVGGGTWLVARASGDGASGAVTRATIGSIEGSVVSPQDIRMRGSEPGVAVATDDWHFYAASASVALTAGGSGSLLVGDVLTSEDGSYSFSVRGVEKLSGYIHATLTEAI